MWAIFTLTGESSSQRVTSLKTDGIFLGTHKHILCDADTQLHHTNSDF